LTFFVSLLRYEREVSNGRFWLTINQRSDFVLMPDSARQMPSASKPNNSLISFVNLYYGEKLNTSRWDITCTLQYRDDVGEKQ
jgi:hypothetical protein